MNGRYLLLWATLAFVCGIGFGKETAFPFFMTAGSCILCGAGSFFCMRMKGARAAFLCMIFALLFAGMLRMDLAETVWRANSHGMIGTEGTFTVVTSGEGLVGDGYIRSPVKLFSVTFSDGEERNLTGDAYLYVPEGKEIPAPDLRIEATGELSGFRFYKNPGKPDWESRYEDENRIGRLYTQSPADVKVIGTADEFPLTRAAYSVRETIREKFSAYVDTARLSLLMTLLFGGNYTELPAGVLDSFTTTGLVHILSVSGSHMALLFGFCVLAGKWFGLPDRTTMGFSLVLMVCYAALAGFVAPVVRAAFMGALAVTALLFGRDKEGILLLAATVFVMTAFDPYYLFDVSFQLSVLASAGLLLYYKNAAAWLSAHRVPKKLSEGIALAFSAQVLTVPVVLYDFHRFPVYFLPSNLFVAPLLETVILLGLASSVIIFVFAPFAGGLLFVTDYFLWAAMRLNFCLSGLPGSVLYLGAMSTEWMIFYYAAVLAWPAGLYRKKYVPAGFLCAGVLLFAFGLWRMPEKIFIVPDLGNAKGAALSADAGTILYYKDSGAPGNAGGRELLSVLGYYGIFSADVMVLDMSDGAGVSAFALDMPIRHIFIRKEKAARAAEFLRAHPEAEIAYFPKDGIMLSDGTKISASGGDVVIRSDACGFYFDGGAPTAVSGLGQIDFWMGGSQPFLSGVNGDKMNTISPTRYVYTGGRGEAAGEDRDFFSLHDVKVFDVGNDGMAAFGLVRGEWVNL